MNAIAEIDKAGRLVVPKKLRDALHLVPGTRLTLHQEGEEIILRQEATPRGLYMKNGTWVYDAGIPPAEEVRDWIEADRDARMQSILGDTIKL
jgi:AbrB family looped-hinge helix DNA binding protein